MKPTNDIDMLQAKMNAVREARISHSKNAWEYEFMRASETDLASQCLERLPRVIEQLAAAEKRAENEHKRRVYYQSIVYDVCNQLDAATGRQVTKGEGVVCGTVGTPSHEVQDILSDCLKAHEAAEARADEAVANREGLRSGEWESLNAEIVGLKQQVAAAEARAERLEAWAWSIVDGIGGDVFNLPLEARGARDCVVAIEDDEGRFDVFAGEDDEWYSEVGAEYIVPATKAKEVGDE